MSSEIKEIEEIRANLTRPGFREPLTQALRWSAGAPVAFPDEVPLDEALFALNAHRLDGRFLQRARDEDLSQSALISRVAERHTEIRDRVAARTRVADAIGRRLGREQEQDRKPGGGVGFRPRSTMS